ncbi:hypothetical protein, partial [Klebsiella pneumoniae]|uniref:hypothetical protein n=1 Tax=Klebsiella pneumoniae TaxID=573 RepID=UPI003EE28C09
GAWSSAASDVYKRQISDRSKRTLSVFKIPKTRKNTPEQLVDEAIKKKNSSSSAEGDVFWVVYDLSLIHI